MDDLKGYFPYSEIRNAQKELISDVKDCIENKKHLIAHAPTGLGKTISSLAPAIKASLEQNKLVFFLTSKHTQHRIAIDTLKEIAETSGHKIIATDIIGKKWLCPVSGIQALSAGDFSDYCKNMREDQKCEFYARTRRGRELSMEAKKVFEELLKLSPMSNKELFDICKASGVCPYEMAMFMARKSNIIIGDYYHVFNSIVSDNLFSKIDHSMEDCIIIVDEAHNLPARIRDLQSVTLTSPAIKRAIKEAKKYGFESVVPNLAKLQELFLALSEGMKMEEERLIKKENITQSLDEDGLYQSIVEEFFEVSKAVREDKKKSAIGGVARFMDVWQGEDESHVRIVKFTKIRGEPQIIISYRCLDPSLISKEIIEKSHSTILLSGTLNPTAMYADLLGFSKDVVQRDYENPFPQRNKLSLIVPETTTKYQYRNEEQFKRIAEICAEASDRIPGNVAIFFPSYYLRDRVYRFFAYLSSKTSLLEMADFSSEDKEEVFSKFEEYRKTGITFLGVISGSFSEGIDLPGDLLKGVIIVGLPLQAPDLEVKELIGYYDDKFGKGWDYGYLFPAMNRTFQSAGRCIRSEKDRGVIIFLDERYAWKNYLRCFPKDMEVEITGDYVRKLDRFFKED